MLKLELWDHNQIGQDKIIGEWSDTLGLPTLQQNGSLLFVFNRIGVYNAAFWLTTVVNELILPTQFGLPEMVCHA